MPVQVRPFPFPGEIQFSPALYPCNPVNRKEGDTNDALGKKGTGSIRTDVQKDTAHPVDHTDQSHYDADRA